MKLPTRLFPASLLKLMYSILLGGQLKVSEHTSDGGIIYNIISPFEQFWAFKIFRPVIGKRKSVTADSVFYLFTSRIHEKNMAELAVVASVLDFHRQVLETSLLTMTGYRLCSARIPPRTRSDWYFSTPKPNGRNLHNAPVLFLTRYDRRKTSINGLGVSDVQTLSVMTSYPEKKGRLEKRERKKINY